MNVFKKLFYLPSLLLLIAYFLSLGRIPNQLILVGGAVVFIFIFLCVFLFRQLKKTKGIGRKFVHIIFFVLIIPVLLLPYAGVFEQGIIPKAIYFLLLVVTVVYLIKINGKKSTVSAFLQPDNYRNFVLLNLILIIFNSPFQDVLPDVFYSPEFKSEYAPKKGPKIYIDEAHHNLHTGSGLYTTFSNILKKDGYNIEAFTTKFSDESLKDIDILVISNALNAKNVDDWRSPIFSAFSKDEITSLNNWVKNGGSLFFIADHMPFGSASKDLALSFGFKFSEGTVIKKVKDGVDLFSRKQCTLISNSITEGRNPSEFVDSIVTFTGQAIEIPDSATPILIFDDEYAHYSPEIRKNIEGVEAESVEGLSQGAYMEYGEGRIVVFGEAAMFTGQLPAGLSFWKKIGLNSDKAENNYKLLLNTVHWLDHKID